MATTKYIVVDGEHLSPNHPRAIAVLAHATATGRADAIQKADNAYYKRFYPEGKVQPPKNALEGRIKLFWVPYQVKSLNQTRYQHWSVASKHIKEAKRAWGWWFRTEGTIVWIVSFRSRLLDSDNYIAGCKGLRDAIAESLGMDDADKFIQWNYHQIIGKPHGTLVVIV